MSFPGKKIISIFLMCLIAIAPVVNSQTGQTMNMDGNCPNCLSNANDETKADSCVEANCLMSFCSFTHSPTSLFHSTGQTFDRNTISKFITRLSVPAYSSFISALLIRPPIAWLLLPVFQPERLDLMIVLRQLGL